MPLRFAFAGFRHGHIFGLLEAVKADQQFQIVAACEEDAATRSELTAGGKVKITHDSFERMLAEAACDVVAIGDYYSKRGPLAIKALQAGRHVITDKPLCTSLAQLDQIEKLATEKRLSVGCQFDMRSSGLVRAVRAAIADGQIGQVQTVAFSGQHPLLFGARPNWYFQEEDGVSCHGGTINDIFIHAADIIPWMTGRRWADVLFARNWSTSTCPAKGFPDAAQLVIRLDNGGGAIGDVSYLAPDKCGYKVPCYWRLTIHGNGGMIEMESTTGKAIIATQQDAQPRCLEPLSAEPNAYLKDFVAEIGGRTSASASHLRTADVIGASRIALAAQAAAGARPD